MAGFLPVRCCFTRGLEMCCVTADIPCSRWEKIQEQDRGKCNSQPVVLGAQPMSWVVDEQFCPGCECDGGTVQGFSPGKVQVNDYSNPHCYKVLLPALLRPSPKALALPVCSQRNQPSGRCPAHQA